MALIWGIRFVMHSRAPRGMSEFTYLVLGFCIWTIVSNTLGKCMAAMDGNKSLLTFAQITPLDIIVSHSVVVWVTCVLNSCILLCIGAFFGHQLAVADASMLLLSLVLAGLLGLGLGMLLGALALYIRTLHNIVPMVMRVLFFASGIIFSVTAVSKKVGDFLLWNPIMQLIEMARSSLCPDYMHTYIDVEYTLCFVMGIFPLGLLLERYTRRRRQP
jgi:capsular polysaccharide transport system permease protein